MRNATIRHNFLCNAFGFLGFLITFAIQTMKVQCQYTILLRSSHVHRSARWCLCAAFIAYGIANMFQAGMEYDGKQEALTGVMMIFIGSVQALMFTMLALIFIRPSIVTARRVLLQLSVVFFVCCCSFRLYSLFQLSFSWRVSPSP